MLYLYAGAGAIGLVSLAVTCYFIMRARADRAQRDAAIAQAASATDLASRLNASLQALTSLQDKGRTNDLASAQVASSDSGRAGAFLAGSTGVPPIGGSNVPKSQLSASTGPSGYRPVPGFARPRAY